MATGKIKQVIDGDTLRLQNDMQVRLAGVNAPELGQRGGQKAKQALRNLVPPGTTIGIAPKGKSYGRTVADVSRKNRSINRAMRRKGYK